MKYNNKIKPGDVEYYYSKSRDLGGVFKVAAWCDCYLA